MAFGKISSYNHNVTGGMWTFDKGMVYWSLIEKTIISWVVGGRVVSTASRRAIILKSHPAIIDPVIVEKLLLRTNHLGAQPPHTSFPAIRDSSC